MGPWHIESSQTGIEPWSSALAGGFLSTEPPGKSSCLLLHCVLRYCRLFSYWKMSLYSYENKRLKQTIDLLLERTTQRDGMGREEGGGFRMGNTYIPVVDSF